MHWFLQLQMNRAVRNYFKSTVNRPIQIHATVHSIYDICRLFLKWLLDNFLTHSAFHLSLIPCKESLESKNSYTWSCDEENRSDWLALGREQFTQLYKITTWQNNAQGMNGGDFLVKFHQVVMLFNSCNH